MLGLLPFIPLVAYGVYTGGDTSGLVLLLLVLVFTKWGPQPRLYVVMAWVALAMELWGTYLGNWTWASEVPWTGLTVWNPPLLVGTFYCCKAAWAGMRDRNYGRIVLTTSFSGLYGNFGQANYGAAKSGMVGLMNVLAEEGRKNNIRVNIISPTAATRMTEELLPPQALQLMKPNAITPAVEYMLSEDAPTRTIMGAGAGSFAVIKILESEGINLPESEWTPDAVAAHFAEISDMSKAKALTGAFEQTQKYVAQAAARAGIKL